MTDTSTADAGREPFDTDDGYFGQDYHRDREAAMGAKAPSGTVDPARPDDAPPAHPDLPPDNGRHASFDPHTGKVQGSGSSAGGGNEGDDLASDSAAGDGYPYTGREGTVQKAPDDLGPPPSGK
ncbi:MULTISPECIES: hypothetical protein [unclassified Sphingomonas]|jgi:hypothetical protein|uniref:hypothetical protein n=1 Tax=unclassified Sphingomonas TaxID=196159 RepID=UPI000E1040C3|nr:MULTISPECIES: hypothetical protein [unclassified Sphingomonas]AXJ94195.1 hypothetical protein DM480_00510 [Sphingomonas sp. FARSPH]